MTETSNIEVIQAAYACFGRGDVAGILDRLTDDVVWQVAAVENAPFTGTRHGKAGAAEFFQLMSEAEETTLFEPREFIAQGDKVAVIGHYAGRVKSTGRAYETYWVQVFTLQDGKIADFQEYTDTAAMAQTFMKAQAA